MTTTRTVADLLPNTFIAGRSETYYYLAPRDLEPHRFERLILGTQIVIRLHGWYHGSIGGEQLRRLIALLVDIQRLVDLAAVNGRDLWIDARPALIEMSTSASTHMTDGRKVLEYDAVVGRYLSWSPQLRHQHFASDVAPTRREPRLRPETSLDPAFEVVNDADSYALTVVPLLLLLQVRGDRKPGDGYDTRVKLLKRWIDLVESEVGGVGSHEMTLAIDDLLGLRPSYVDGLVKFARWKDQESALRTALNAARDLGLLRHLTDANRGKSLYANVARPTALVTEDKALRRAFTATASFWSSTDVGAIPMAVLPPNSIPPQAREALKEITSDLRRRQMERTEQPLASLERLRDSQERLLDGLIGAPSGTLDA